MANDAERRVLRLAGIWLALAVASLLLPRLAPPGEGFAPAGTAIIVLAGGLLLSALLALVLLAQTLRLRGSLGFAARVCGIAPAVVTLGALLALWALLGY